MRPGDVLIATDDASDLGLAEGDRARIDAIGYCNRLTLSVGTDECDENGREVRRVIACSGYHPGLRPARYRWTVEIEVAAVWVADGIDLTSERMHEITRGAFPYLRGDEVTARTIEGPDANDVAREMGYQSAADRVAQDAKRRGK